VSDRWPGYLRDYHRAHPGITEELLAGAHDAGHRTPYDWLVEPVPAEPTTVVDLACGSAPLVGLLPGHRVIGIDQSAAELARARQRCTLLARAVATGLPLAGGAAGAVVASMALMLLAPLEDVLGEVARVLQVGGVFVATVPTRDGGSVAFAAILRVLGQAGVSYPERLDAAVGSRFTASGLTLRSDKTALFTRPVRGPTDAERVVRSFYAPGAGPDKVAAAVKLLQSRMRSAPVEVTYRLRRLVAVR
jgi:SAM-dependent methyltransferase